jgi:hypothetical protein
VSTQHDQNTFVPSRTPSTDRCLRHHVWMAACGDCRTARTPLRDGGRLRPAATR